MSTKPLRHLAGAAQAEILDGRPQPRRPVDRPALRFTPYAWARLLFLRDAGPTEVGGFGISSPGDHLLIEDVRLVRQRCTRVSVEFADEAVADFFDEQVDLGRRPEEFGRVWVHTHPGDCPNPSGTDEETFGRAFGRADWAVMFILARGGDTFARLQFGCGPGASLRIPVRIDYAAPFPAADHDSWQQEYAACIERPSLSPPLLSRRDGDRLDDLFEFFEEHHGGDALDSFEVVDALDEEARRALHDVPSPPKGG